MLSRFTVGNFLSFNKPQSFSMLASSIQKHKQRLFEADDVKLLKFSSIYGANAAGKSNLIKAMAFARNIITHGTAESPDTSFYKLDPKAKSLPSYFEFEICIGGRLYSYGFEMIISEREITEEWLILLGPSKNEELFTRNSTTGRYTYDTTLLSRKEDAAHFEIYINDLKHVANKLFLQDIVTNKEAIYAENERLAILKQVYHWFEVLDISFPDSLVSGYSCFSTTSTDEILAAIRTFATGISHVEAKKVSKEKALEEISSDFKKKIDKALVELVNQNKSVNPASGMRISCNGKLYLVRMNEKEPEFNEITFEHNKLKDVTFSMDEESDGTQRLFDMLTVLLCTKEPAVFVIDEIDRSLHPQMTVHFIKNFLALAKKKQIQLVVTTHESHLMDLSILRQDEIWFVEKNALGASLLIPFDRFKERFDKKIQKAYLDGRYGGVPLFDSFFFPQDFVDEDEDEQEELP
ncbi:MAG TPA: transporter [Sphaerochaeta sp.]|jgi:hypothetical protein|nr:transporter [Sphaerochaeta sp.]